jgi:aminoglycoside 3-N-acetyltransferase
MPVPLFRTADSSWVTDADLNRALRELGADEAEILFIHSGMGFGLPNLDLKRSELLGSVWDCLLGLEVPTLVCPTYTFSFCNGVDYDVRQSRSRMGALNEYVRQLPGAVRSVDPLMSCAAVGRNLDLVRDLGHNSCGAGSTFDKIHARGAAARFLFLGVEPAKCMTYTHYVEERLHVPYRYDREFRGNVTDAQGRSTPETYTLPIRYHGVIPITDDRFQRRLLGDHMLKSIPCGDSYLYAIDEPTAYRAITERIEANPKYFIMEPFDRSRVTTDFQIRDMVAL